MTREIICSYLRKYLDKQKLKFTKVGKTGSGECPFCGGVAQILPNTGHKINCFGCKKKYDIIDIARKVENLTGNEEDIIQHIKEMFDIKIQTDRDIKNKEEVLDYYEKNNFSIVPIKANDKMPIEKDWTNKEHRNKEEWERWIINGLNLGVRTGEVSGITLIDLDVLSNSEKDEICSDTISEDRTAEIFTKKRNILEDFHKKNKEILGNPVIQNTLGGQHLIYKYEKNLPKTAIKLETLKIDLENDGGQVVVFPSIVSGQSRAFESLHEIETMPEDFQKMLLEHTTTPVKTKEDKIKEDIQSESFKLELFEEGTRNSSLVKLGGIFRKQFSPIDTKKILHVLNNHNHRSGSYREIEAMAKELEKYNTFDEQALADEVIMYLKGVSEANRNEIAQTLVGTNRGEDKKRIDKVLSYLVAEDRLIKIGTKYELKEELNWSGNLLNVGVPVNFKVPYFHTHAYFNWDDVIIIGSRTKYGKTTLAMNIVKRLVNQGICPDYIYNESGGRYAKVALKLGMKNNDFYSAFCANPDKVLLRKKKVTIFDWVKPINFARTDTVFSDLVEKNKESNGFLICFVQLRKNNNFFAEDQIEQFPALVSKYVYDDKEGLDTKFIITSVRDGKMKGKEFEIPCMYTWDTHVVKSVREIQEEQEKETSNEKEM